MSEINFWENRNIMTFKKEFGYDFISPAEQSIVRRFKSPLWEPTSASRCDYPMWERPDIFRTLSYSDTRDMLFSIPKVKYQSGIVKPSGLVSLQMVERTSPVFMSDRELYHYEVQKVFAVFSQFDSLLVDQVAAFAGIGVERAHECCTILWSQGILERSTRDWRLFDSLGYVWRINKASNKVKSYVSGMDSILRAVTVGEWDITDVAPGYGSRSGLKHNLFTAEIMLRLAESADNVIGVWGDPFLSESLFHKQDPDALARRSHADAAVVTKDGSIVLFEVVGAINKTSYVNQTLVDKAASWVGVIANSPFDLHVVFIDTTFYNTFKATIKSVDIGLRKESHKFAPEEYSRERAIRHIGVTGGHYWFPDDGVISEAGTRLVAYNPYHKMYKQFDVPDNDFSDRDTRKNVIVNSVTALHNPGWILHDMKERNYVAV